MAHSEETKKKISQGQRIPRVVAAKKKAAKKYWNDVKSGKRKRKKSSGRPTTPVEERFWDKIRKTESCWLFESNHGGGLYGMLSGYGMAHRLSWEIHKGKIPDGKMVLHKCDVPKCVNPEHLFLGDHKENMKDMVRKARSLKGSKSPNSKLTEKEVLEIRHTYKSERISQHKLARIYRVHQTLISMIVRRKIWDHI